MKLEDLQRRLWSDYEKVLIQEELIWYQKSRNKWLTYEDNLDKNTKYFHASTVTRRKRKRIVGLMNNKGTWIEDEDILRNMATNFFQ